MENYLNLLKKIIDIGYEKSDRTGTGVKSLFGERLEFDLNKGFPLLTTKKIYFKGVITELLWFLQGGTNIKYLQQENCHIWDEWADENGELGPIYGYQWRKWNNIDNQNTDQIKNLLNSIKNNPNSRRHIISAWNVSFLPDETISPQANVKKGKMALAPCHVLAQFYLNRRKLSCQVYLRSQDYFLGTPFNIASYALLTHLIANNLGLEVEKLIWIGGDVHLYNNHLKQAKIQLNRECGKLPKLKILNKRKDLFNYKLTDIQIEGYFPKPTIKAKISV